MLPQSMTKRNNTLKELMQNNRNPSRMELNHLHSTLQGQNNEDTFKSVQFQKWNESLFKVLKKIENFMEKTSTGIKDLKSFEEKEKKAEDFWEEMREQKQVKREMRQNHLLEKLVDSNLRVEDKLKNLVTGSSQKSAGASKGGGLFSGLFGGIGGFLGGAGLAVTSLPILKGMLVAGLTFAMPKIVKYIYDNWDGIKKSAFNVWEWFGLPSNYDEAVAQFKIMWENAGMPRNAEEMADVFWEIWEDMGLPANFREGVDMFEIFWNWAGMPNSRQEAADMFRSKWNAVGMPTNWSDITDIFRQSFKLKRNAVGMLPGWFGVTDVFRQSFKLKRNAVEMLTGRSDITDQQELSAANLGRTVTMQELQEAAKHFDLDVSDLTRLNRKDRNHMRHLHQLSLAYPDEYEYFYQKAGWVARGITPEQRKERTTKKQTSEGVGDLRLIEAIRKGKNILKHGPGDSFMCGRGVQRIFEDAGLIQRRKGGMGFHARGWGDWLSKFGAEELHHDFSKLTEAEQKQLIKNLPPGKVVVFEPTKDDDPYGHVAVTLGGGREYSDREASLLRSFERGVGLNRNVRVFTTEEPAPTIQEQLPSQQPAQNVIVNNQNVESPPSMTTETPEQFIVAGLFDLVRNFY